jgi:transketolase
VPLIDRKTFASAEGLRRGGYILAEADGAVARPSGRAQGDGTRQRSSDASRDGVSTASGSDRVDPSLILIATGSEVSLALESREKLQADGIPTRVVSMPCLELFEEQAEDYRDEVLPTSITARLAIEAGVRQGWDRYVGPQGDVICLDRFGASAPGDVALKNLGFNVENVIKHARALL